MLKELRRCVKQEKKDKNIFDIVVYGSTVKGKESPGDIDIVVIFLEGKLKDRLERIQLIKKKITLDAKIDIKGIGWGELFQAEFFARSGIFHAGISLFDNKPFSHKIGFHGNVLFTYTLQDKSHSEKVKFNYVLSGRKNEIGIVERLEGHHVAPGIILLPIKNSLEFEEVLNTHLINYSKKNILVEGFE